MLKLFALALATLLLVPTASVLAQSQSDLTTIRLVGPPNDDFVPALYAQQAGLFRAAGMRVQIESVRSGALAVTAVTAGAADIGMTDLIPLISAHVRGVPVVMIAPSGMYLANNPESGLIVPKNSPIRSAKDLDGKTVSAPGLRGISYLGTRVWSDKNGGNSETIRWVELSSSTAASALDSARIDGATVPNPFFPVDVATGRYRVVADYVAAIAPRVLQTGWFTTTSYTAQHRAAVEAFVRVIQHAGEYTNQHHEETVSLLARLSALDPAAIRHMNRSIAGTTLSADEVQPLIDAAAKYHLIDNNFPAQELFLR
jgi:NitT/TauT family transport system substrate-binding protein